MSGLSLGVLAAQITFVPVAATGGTVTTPGDGYRYHTFNGSGNLVVSSGGIVDYLIVAGGGATYGADADAGGGAGAGGYLSGTFTVSATTYTFVIGAGGSNTPGAAGWSKGNNTTGLSLTAIGGGGYDTPNGGSGLGGSAAGVLGLGTAGQGNNGGAGFGNSNIARRASGGGGGAGATGTAAGLSTPGTGGNGLQWLNGTYYAGGGGGFANRFGSSASPGLGTSNPPAANSGGGATMVSGGTNGGSGIVIVRYPI